MPKRWIVVSLDSLANLALAPYGSSWNSTENIDRLAAQGTTWDRVIVPSDDATDTLRQCWTADVGGGQSWIELCRRSGAVELFAAGTGDGQDTTTDPIARAASEVGFDACTLVDWQPGDHAAQEVEQTTLSHLVMALLERLQPAEPGSGKATDWSVLWLHSDFLSRHWDAPRWLFPLAELDEDDAPIDPADPGYWDLQSQPPADQAGMSAASQPTGRAVAPAPLQETTLPPHYRIAADDHPDWVTSWMQTYGCQVRLVDSLIQWIRDVIDPLGQDIGLALVGTSGFSLGQNGWIGSRAGPIRSPQIHVPVILHAPGQPPLRWSELLSLPQVMPWIVPGAASPGPQHWAEVTTLSPPGAAADQAEDFFPRLITHSARATRVITTRRWFFVRQSDEQAALYLKPDDRDDANDVVGRCRDVIERLESAEQSTDDGVHDGEQGDGN